MSTIAIINAMVPWFANEYVVAGAPRSFTSIPEAGAQTLDLTDFTVAAKVFATSADRGAFRHLQTCKGDNFNKVSFFRFAGGSAGNEGELEAFLRTPAAQIAMTTATKFDNGTWVNAGFVLDSSGPIFRLIVAGVEEDTDTTNPGTTIGTKFSGWGNWDAAGVSPGPDESLLGRLTASYIIDAAMTPAQIDNLLNNDVLPAGMNILNELTFPDAGNTSRVVREIGPV